MSTPRAIVVVDLGFGDAGKGTIVDYLTRAHDARTVVRFNGGPQAGHNVVLPDGRHHTFSQFGSGTFVPGVRTLLSKQVLIEPYAMLREEAHLAEVGVTDAFDRLDVDATCRVITPFHIAANRLREKSRGATAHGTCGMGVGETAADSLARPDLTLLAGDLRDVDLVARKLRALQQYKLESPGGLPWHGFSTRADDGPDLTTVEQADWIDAAIENYRTAAARFRIVQPDDIRRRLRNGTTIFEAAQGVLLDEDAGFHPHTTWSRTTTHAATSLLESVGITSVRRIGVIRTYATRHGTGPLVTEDASLKPLLPEPHNDDSGRQGKFRVGHFDAVATRYALRQSPVDGLAVTHVDRLDRLPALICDRYQGTDDGQIPSVAADDLTARSELTTRLFKCAPILSDCPTDPDQFSNHLEGLLHKPVGIVSTGPTFKDKRLIS